MAKGDNLGEFELLVTLAILRVRGSAYGMEVRQEIERTTGRDVTIGAVYATLERLEEKGLLASRRRETGAKSASGQGRRFFTVEPAGLEALARARETLTRMWEGVNVPLPGDAGR